MSALLKDFIKSLLLRNFSRINYVLASTSEMFVRNAVIKCYIYFMRKGDLNYTLSNLSNSETPNSTTLRKIKILQKLFKYKCVLLILSEFFYSAISNYLHRIKCRKALKTAKKVKCFKCVLNSFRLHIVEKY